MHPCSVSPGGELLSSTLDPHRGDDSFILWGEAAMVTIFHDWNQKQLGLMDYNGLIDFNEF
jgi:hypothetical protein